MKRVAMVVLAVSIVLSCTIGAFADYLSPCTDEPIGTLYGSAQIEDCLNAACGDNHDYIMVWKCRIWSYQNEKYYEETSFNEYCSYSRTRC